MRAYIDSDAWRIVNAATIGLQKRVVPDSDESPAAVAQTGWPPPPVCKVSSDSCPRRRHFKAPTPPALLLPSVDAHSPLPDTAASSTGALFSVWNQGRRTTAPPALFQLPFAPFLFFIAPGLPYRVRCRLSPIKRPIDHGVQKCNAFDSANHGQFHRRRQQSTNADWRIDLTNAGRFNNQL
uniref:Uncharacterized protein n=1 Tax=Plectus sambesii TaxID=2011161 RepID=A0A914XP13_9BILA